jgi:hypothetical protein
MFLSFRDLLDVKRTQTFCHVIFLKNKRAREEEVNVGCHEGQKRAHHVGYAPGRVVGAILGLERRIDTILDSMDWV